MDSNELRTLCLSDRYVRPYLYGVIAVDLLPSSVSYPCCMIVNTDPSDNSGKHWIAIFIDALREANYFCSYGQPPGRLFKDWLATHSRAWMFVRKRIQGELSTTCGQYCVCYLHFRCRGVSTKQFLSLFSCAGSENDEIIAAFVNGMYNKNTVVCDERFGK